jgi:hypothetical protein
MRRVHRPSGRAPASRTQFQELVVLVQAAIDIANVERWALGHSELSPPAGLKGLLRTNAYEVTVVDIFHRLARREFERSGYVAIWERPLLTGARGRPRTVDVSLFKENAKTESRVELGLYTRTKLKNDAKKLFDESGTPGLPGYSIDFNVLALWDIAAVKTTDELLKNWWRTFVADGKAASTKDYRVRPLLGSIVDLFTPRAGANQYAAVGLFDVVPL